MEQPEHRRPITHDDDLTGGFADLADSADQSAEPLGIHERDLREIDDDRRLSGERAELLAELLNAVRVELADRATHGHCFIPLDLNLDHGCSVRPPPGVGCDNIVPTDPARTTAILGSTTIGRYRIPVTNVLIATEAAEVLAEVNAAIGGPSTQVTQVTAGRDVRGACIEVEPDLVVLDLQIGSMGGIAACLDLRLEEGADRLAPQNVLLLLDREADVFLARRSGADGWLIKPLDARRLERAVAAVLAGDSYTEGPEPTEV